MSLGIKNARFYSRPYPKLHTIGHAVGWLSPGIFFPQASAAFGMAVSQLNTLSDRFISAVAPTPPESALLCATRELDYEQSIEFLSRDVFDIRRARRDGFSSHTRAFVLVKAVSEREALRDGLLFLVVLLVFVQPP